MKAWLYAQGSTLGGFIIPNTDMLGFIHMGGRLGAAGWGCLGRLGLPLGAPPIHTKPTQWPYGTRNVLTCPPGWAGGPCRTYEGIF